jgi:hypothetical protein
MKPTTFTYQIKHFHTLNQLLSSIKSITFIKINNILGGTRLNSQRLDQLLETIQSTRQLHLKEEGLNFQDRSSFAKHSGATDEVWYYRYHTKWTQREGIRGRHESAHMARRPRPRLDKLMQLLLCNVKTCMDYL